MLQLLRAFIGTEPRLVSAHNIRHVATTGRSILVTRRLLSHLLGDGIQLRLLAAVRLEANVALPVEARR